MKKIGRSQSAKDRVNAVQFNLALAHLMSPTPVIIRICVQVYLYIVSTPSIGPPWLFTITGVV